jgi:hypothetical protein
MSRKKRKQISCVCFDLETTNLSADFGVVLCGMAPEGSMLMLPQPPGRR